MTCGDVVMHEVQVRDNDAVKILRVNRGRAEARSSPVAPKRAYNQDEPAESALGAQARQ
jgi:hypothetical protein